MGLNPRPLTRSMAQSRYLARAPIVEAVIDVRVRTAPDLRVEVFEDLGELAADYPKRDELTQFEMGFTKLPGKPPDAHQVDRGKIGFRHVSEDGKFIAQLRKDGFTFSRLAPYTRWEEIFAEASRLYRHYLQTAAAEEVHRIAVRYINRLPLPEGDVNDFSPFLTAPPPFPHEVPAVMTGFLTQVQVQEPDSLIQATVTQTIQRGEVTPGFVPVILDLDVFEVGAFPLEPDRLLSRFEALRMAKNRLFFSSITERTAELFS